MPKPLRKNFSNNLIKVPKNTWTVLYKNNLNNLLTFPSLLEMSIIPIPAPTLNKASKKEGILLREKINKYSRLTLLITEMSIPSKEITLKNPFNNNNHSNNHSSLILITKP